MSSLFEDMLDGKLSADQIKNVLTEIADRGETAREIAAAARAMRARMISVAGPQNAIDVCGTGGDGSHSLNISTAVAIVVAACGVPVAKHGNRAASSKAGAADTLEALGLDFSGGPERSAAALEEIGIGFLFAQQHHPALGPIAPIRKALGRRTIFNLLGPLANPARVRRQLIGVAHPDIIPLYAEAASMLAYDRLMIVSGHEGLDELSISGPSAFAMVEGRAVTFGEITPKDAGLPCHPAAALKGGDAAYNADALRRLLLGETGAYRDAVLLNSAAALLVAGEASHLKEGVEEAAETIDKGMAKSLLDCWITFSKGQTQ